MVGCFNKKNENIFLSLFKIDGSNIGTFLSISVIAISALTSDAKIMNHGLLIWYKVYLL